jgi:hypothetical protein
MPYFCFKVLKGTERFKVDFVDRYMNKVQFHAVVLSVLVII